MSTKVKVIIISVIVLIVVSLTASLFIYISHLNNKITELETTIVEQNNTIEILQNNVDSLQNNIESYRATFNVINDYIESVNKIKSEESAIKQAVYEEVISNPESMEWFNEKLPDNIIQAVLENSSLSCE